jgi:hypothetical protein
MTMNTNHELPSMISDNHETRARSGSFRGRVWTRLAQLGAAFGVASMALGCADADSVDAVDSADESVAETVDSLFARGDSWPVSSDGVTYVPVCWTFSGNDTDKNYVRSAVTGAWEAYSSIKFTGWGICDYSSSQVIRIHLKDEANFLGSTSYYAYSSGNAVMSSGFDIYLNLTYDYYNPNTGLNCDIFGGACDHCHTYKSYCTGITALHEFGHAIGFFHEQQRADNTGGQYCDEWQSGEAKGPSNGVNLTSSYDTDSIMNYCGEWSRSTPHVSQGDAYGIEVRYGTKPNKLTNQVLIYKDQNFTSEVQALYPGDYDMSSLTIGNDALSSLRIPSGWTVTLYTNSGFSGTSTTLTSDEAKLQDISWEDKASSIRVTGPSNSYPIIYKDGSYSGSSQTLRPGVYNASDLTIGNDAVSSISVPSGWTVTLYESSNFGGSSITRTSSASAMSSLSFNDKTSSIKVVGPTGWNPVVIYKDASYTGEAQALWPGRYEASDLTIGNDELTSLSVPTGWTVYALKGSPSYDDMRTYTSSQSSISGDSFNDVTSAIVVEGPTQ